VTELSIEYCEDLNRIAEENGLCSNCHHTLACCDGTCWAMELDDPWSHFCVPNEDDARKVEAS
jgi:hypothetical protein